MKFILDLVILGIILLTTFIGYKKGLINVALHLCGFIIALAISLLLYHPVSDFIVNHTPLASQLETHIESRISNSSQEETSNFIANYYKNFKNASTTMVAHGVSYSIIQIATVFIIFIVTRLLLFFIRFSGDFMAKLPVIKQMNHVGGFIYGILLGFILIYAFFTLIAILAPIIDLSKPLEFINDSIVGNIMYHNNIIFMFLV